MNYKILVTFFLVSISHVLFGQEDVESNISYTYVQLSDSAYWKKLKFKIFDLAQIQHKYDSALLMLAPLDTIASKHNNVEILAFVYYQKSSVFSRTGKLDSAIIIMHKAIKMYEAYDRQLGEGQGYTALGSYYLAIDDFESALKNYNIGYQVFEDIGNETEKVFTAMEIGKCLSIQGNHISAKPYFLQFLQYALESNNSWVLANAYGDLGELYLKLNQYDSAIYLSQKSLVINKKNGNAIGMGVNFEVLGSSYLYLNEFSRVEENLLKALAYYTESNWAYGLMSVHASLGECYDSLQQETKAIEYYEKALLINDENHRPQFSLVITENLKTIYKRQKNYKKALEYADLYKVLSDSILTIERQKAILTLEAQFDTKVKEQQLALNSAEIREQKAVIENRSLTIKLIIVSVIFLTILVLWYFFRQKKNQQIALHKQALEFSELQLQSAINSQETERRRFAKDLHDGFGQVISILKMNIDRIIGNGTDDLEHRTIVYEETKDMLDKMNDELRGICFDLMPQTLLQSGLVAAVKEFASRVNLAGKVIIELHVFGMEERLTEIVEVSLYRVIQEWTNNILKYGSATKITVQLTQDAQELTLTIEDNGAGFNTNLLEESQGNGWRNIQSRSKLMKGEVWVDSRPDIAGSTLTINLNPQQILVQS